MGIEMNILHQILQDFFRSNGYRNTARMDAGGKGVTGLKRSEEFPPNFAHFRSGSW